MFYNYYVINISSIYFVCNENYGTQDHLFIYHNIVESIEGFESLISHDFMFFRYHELLH